jgi:hypothetical protein
LPEEKVTVRKEDDRPLFEFTALDARLAVRIGELASPDRSKVADGLRELLGKVLA